jgi:hypothetical protein
MAKLICSTIASLDGYVADVDGNFDWAAPEPDWSTSSTCSSRPSWWEAATDPCRTTLGCRSN